VPTTDDDHGKQEEHVGQAERLGSDEVDQPGIEDTSHAAIEAAEGEGRHAQDRDFCAHRWGGQIVVAHRAQSAPQRGVDDKRSKHDADRQCDSLEVVVVVLAGEVDAGQCGPGDVVNAL